MRPFEPKFIWKAFGELIPYLGVTLSIMLVTVLLGSVLGAVLAIAKVGRNKLLKRMAEVYTLVLRCTPPIVLLFIVFYGLPELLSNTLGVNINNISKGFFVTITFTLLFAATISEVMRSAYESIDRGQYEAGASIGMTQFQIFRRIILPQCIAVMLPNFGNSLVSLMKEGALAYTIGFIDVMGKGQLIIGNHYGAYALETYIALALIYWGMTIVIEKGFRQWEMLLSKGKRL